MRTRGVSSVRSSRAAEAAQAAPPGAPGEGGGEALVSIGAAAELGGVTTRTLRYYEELGLVSSSRPGAGSQRRFAAADIERLRRIKELQSLLGLDLDQIAEQLQAADRLELLREEYRAGPPAARREALVEEALDILSTLREKVVERQERLAAFLSDLDERISRARAVARREIAHPGEEQTG